jgi:PAS domain S-box-containing protein
MRANNPIAYVPKLLVREMGELRNQFMTSFEQGKTIFLIVDEHGEICYVSRYVKDILHFSPEDLVGTSIFKIAEPESLLKLKHFIASNAGQLDQVTYFKDLSFQCTDCERHFFDGSFVAKSSDFGIRYLFYLHDVTERKEESEKLSKVNMELDNFIYRASHDLRAPLLSLSGLINLSEITGSNENAEYTNLMRQTVKRLDTFVTQLAHYTRNTHLSINYARIDFYELFSTVIQSYCYLDHTEKIKFTVEVDRDQVVYSDVFRLKIIINNLVSNAIKYHNLRQPNPYIKLSVHNADKRIVISVTDNGTGIDPENIDTIFDMFKRSSDKSEGSGLGLYIVNKALQMIGGTIHVKSRYGLGSSFIIDIPNKVVSDPSIIFASHLEQSATKTITHR